MDLFQKWILSVFLVLGFFTANAQEKSVQEAQEKVETNQAGESAGEKVAYQLKPNVVTLKNNIIQRKHFNQAQFHQALLGELYNQFNKPKLTLKHYLPLALESENPDLVKRVTEIATGTSQLTKGLKAAKHWVEISPKSLEAQQYLTLLLLRNGQLKKSAEQLRFIRQIVDMQENSGDKRQLVSKGLKFIGALLIVEAHHDKAYRVFQYYIKNQELGSTYKDQEQLVLASLAMKAKQYEDVVSAFDNMKIADSDFFASAAVMKSKALKKLGRFEEAIILLQHVVKTKKASDSIRLELTRLLISVGKKNQASTLLERLIKKHPNNNDLLKALVALNINQKNWQVASKNTKKLALNNAYKSEANYFYGEIYEGRGELKRALAFYKNVKKGVFLRSSHSKRVKVLTQIEGVEASQQWLQLEQKKSSKQKDKVYWLKLEADVLSDAKLAGNKLDEAIQLYNKIIALTPQKPRYRYYRGLLFERTQQIDLAETDFKYVVNQSKQNADALNALGFLLVKHTHRFDEAKSYIEKADRLKPNDPLILGSLGWVYFRTGEVKRAEITLRKAFKGLKTPEVASHLIKVLSQSKKQHEARLVFNIMISKYPENELLEGLRSSLW